MYGRSMITRALALACALALALAGCGGGSNEPTSTRIAFTSPVLASGGVIPKRYQCAPKIWLPLRWGNVPSSARELVLYFSSFGSPTIVGNEITNAVSVAFIIGVHPAQHLLAYGHLPAGVYGLSAPGLPVCPSKTSGRQFVFRLFALPAGSQVTTASFRAKTPSRMLARLRDDAVGLGEFTARYG
jgi:hypothetical protein